jgi:protein-tyrosine phosphatase
MTSEPTVSGQCMLGLMPCDLAWDGCVNARDLGGFTTPAGETAFRIFVRADNARKLTPAGWRAAREHGIRTVLDLRSEPECVADPAPPPEFIHRRLSLFDHFDGDTAYRAEFAARVASLDVTEKFRALYREALELDAARFAESFAVLAEADGGVLIHCVGGKDRTGLLAALLLRIVGVPVAEVEADYVHSETRARLAYGTPSRDVRAPRDVIGEVIRETEARHRTIGAYLRHAGASAGELERLCRRFAPGDP